MHGTCISSFVPDYAFAIMKICRSNNQVMVIHVWHIVISVNKSILLMAVCNHEACFVL